MTRNLSIELGVGSDQLTVDFSIAKNPGDITFPTGNIKKEHMAKAAMSEYCFECPNSLICISGHVGVQHCSNCERVYIDGSMIPSEIRCKGFMEQSQIFVPNCVKCAEEFVQENLVEALKPFYGQQLNAGAIDQMKASLKATAHKLLEEKGWHINVDVIMVG